MPASMTMGNLIATDSSTSFVEGFPMIFWLVLALILAVLLIGMLALLVRYWLTRRQDSGGAIGFTLADMRRMHREGLISDEEFEATKAKMIANHSAVSGIRETPQTPKAEPPGPAKDDSSSQDDEPPDQSAPPSNAP